MPLQFRFENPWLLLLALLPLAYLLLRRIWRKRRSVVAIRIASLAPFAAAPKSWRQRLAWIPTGLFLLSWWCLAIAIARPQEGMTQIVDRSEGIAIMMIVDRSGSMRAPMDFTYPHGPNRLDTAKELFSEFVFGSSKFLLDGRHSDLIGLISFARYPTTVCPLTMDRNALKFTLKGIDFVGRDEAQLDGTAIGDAITMGVARLVATEKTLAAQTRRNIDSYKIQSKIIILLTDGQDEGMHQYTIAQAGELAKRHGIKVYSIAVGNYNQSYLSRFNRNYMPPPDTTDIQKLAQDTGGKFSKCGDIVSLRDAYKEIDRLEKSSITAQRFVHHRDIFQYFAIAALGAILAGILLNATLFRRIS